jgi:hypothetical protein
MQRAPDLRARRDSGEIGILFLAKSLTRAWINGVKPARD